MKGKLFVYCMLLLSVYRAQAQDVDFSFVNHSTTLIKAAHQTPAHWYLECMNHRDYPLNLRWRVVNLDVPQQWVIDFVDQTNSAQDIQLNDEMDFELEVLDVLPQKFIISAHLNLTAGQGTVELDFFDPNNLDYVERISYHFIVSPSPLGLEEIQSALFEFNGQEIKALNGELFSVMVVDESGKVVVNETQISVFNPSNFNLKGLSFISLQQGNNFQVFKTIASGN